LTHASTRQGSPDSGLHLTDDDLLRLLRPAPVPQMTDTLLDEEQVFGWITQEYERLYNLRPTPTALADARNRWWSAAPYERRASLVPWEVRREHRWSYALLMLGLEERRRAGGDASLTERDRARLEAWLDWMRARDVVLDYDPTSEAGLRCVPRRPGLDFDILRDPRW